MGRQGSLGIFSDRYEREGEKGRQYRSVAIPQLGLMETLAAHRNDLGALGKKHECLSPVPTPLPDI